jgi:hypothetical protein
VVKYMSPLDRDRYFEKRRRGKSYAVCMYMGDVFSQIHIHR